MTQEQAENVAYDFNRYTSTKASAVKGEVRLSNGKRTRNEAIAWGWLEDAKREDAEAAII